MENFVHIGQVCGGNLKNFQDDESLQAQWLSSNLCKLRSQKIQLRAMDCVDLIHLAQDWHKLPDEKRCSGGFITAPHLSSTLRLVVAHQEK